MGHRCLFPGPDSMGDGLSRDGKCHRRCVRCHRPGHREHPLPKSERPSLSSLVATIQRHIGIGRRSTMKFARLNEDAVLRRIFRHHPRRSTLRLRTVLKCPRCKARFRTTVDRDATHRAPLRRLSAKRMKGPSRSALCIGRARPIQRRIWGGASRSLGGPAQPTARRIGSPLFDPLSGFDGFR